MKNLLTAFTLGVTLLGCSNLPIKTDIKEDHFRLENFKREQGVDLEYVHLMCFKKRPTQWAEPKQYISGEHDLWVKASVSNPDVLNSQKEAFVNFNVNLDSNKSYMLNRKGMGIKYQSGYKKLKPVRLFRRFLQMSLVALYKLIMS